MLKSLYGTKIDAGIPSIIDGNNISSANAKADLFNNHFLRKSALPQNLPDLPPLQPCVHNLSNIETNEEEVKNVLLGLNVNKSSGYDKLVIHY